MKFKSALLTQASGSVGGIVASHNAGGMYFRARTIPTDPNTDAQAVVRAAVAALSDRWGNTLTAVQRTAWGTYAANVAMTNTLGDAIHLSGQMHYIRSNVPRYQRVPTPIDDAPVIFNLGDFTLPVLSFSVAADEVSCGFTVADDWVSEDNTYMLAWMSTAQSQTINFWKGPYRQNGFIDGDNAAPPASPQVWANLHPYAEGQRVFWRLRILRADGRLSASATGSFTAAA